MTDALAVDAALYGFFFQAEDGIRDLVRSRGLGDVYKRQISVSDANGDAITKYRFADGGSASSSGYLTLNGSPLSLIHI